MLNFELIVDILQNHGLQESDARNIAQEIVDRHIQVGRHVYVVTQYNKYSEWEVVDAVVTRITKSRICKRMFTVEGKYKDSSRFAYSCGYCANFSETSLGKTVYFTESEANDACKRKNAKVN